MDSKPTHKGRGFGLDDCVVKPCPFACEGYVKTCPYKEYKSGEQK